MSGNKRQIKLNLLASQKLSSRSRRAKKNISKKKKLNLFLNFFSSILLKVKNLFFLFVLFLNKKSAVTYAIIFFVLCFFSLKVIINTVEKKFEREYPTQIKVLVENKKIEKLIYNEVSRKLEISKLKNETRPQFLQRVNFVLNSIENIDRYWVRLGLDAVLQVSATLQVPLLVIKLKNNDRYVISNRLQIVTKNPKTSEYDSLIKLDLLEYSLKLRPKSASSKNSVELVDSVNFPWLIKQSYTISNSLVNIGAGYKLEKLAWSSANGFKLFMTTKNEFTLEPEFNVQTIAVNLGHDELPRKINRLKIFLTTLKGSKKYPTEIDLNYIDKAIFKIAQFKTLSQKPYNFSNLN